MTSSAVSRTFRALPGTDFISVRTIMASIPRGIAPPASPSTAAPGQDNAEGGLQPMRRKHSTISLLPAERLLRELLLDCREDMQRSGGTMAEPASRLKIWITGGWVRDRLLGIPSSDIDIALSSVTGRQMAKAVTATIRRRAAQYSPKASALGLDLHSFRGFNILEQNVGKAKNLETAMGRLFSLDLDLVNLRQERYSPDSRTPEMEFGTPEEDALRRDATVNALFFDLDTEEVVDLTGRGLHDMDAGIMRTPLPPRQTFLDDPLRVLRLIRMCSKLGYTLDPDAEACIAHPEIHSALSAKISRERVRIEVMKMIKAPYPQIGLELLHQCGLWPAVFLHLQSSSIYSLLRDRLPVDEPTTPMDTPTRISPWPARWPLVYKLFDLVLKSDNSLSRMIPHVRDLHEYWIAVLYAPLAPMAGAWSTKQLEKALEVPVEAFKLTLPDRKLLTHCLYNLPAIRALAAAVASGNTPLRSTIGMAIRTWGPSWRVQILYALFADLMVAPTVEIKPEAYNANDDKDDRLFQSFLRRYTPLVDAIEQLRLGDVVNLRPIVDGNELVKLAGAAKPGPWTGMALQQLIAWQLDNEAATVDRARAWLEQGKQSLSAEKDVEPAVVKGPDEGRGGGD